MRNSKNRQLSSTDKKKFKQFTKLMQQGIESGAIEYGADGYLKHNMIDMAIEEVRDLACYAYFLFLKLQGLQTNVLKASEIVEGNKK